MQGCRPLIVYEVFLVIPLPLATGPPLRPSAELEVVCTIYEVGPGLLSGGLQDILIEVAVIAVAVKLFTLPGFGSGVLVEVGMGVLVGVEVTAGVWVDVGVGVTVGVLVEVGVEVLTGVGLDGIEPPPPPPETVGVRVGVGLDGIEPPPPPETVDVRVGVGVGLDGIEPLTCPRRLYHLLC